MSRPEKLMLGFSALFLAGAVGLKYIPMSTKGRTLVGLIEVVVATGTGIVFGLLGTRKA